jgi:ribonuclease E
MAVSMVNLPRTRSGRTIKKPQDVYVPEIVDFEDEYSDEDDSDFDMSGSDIDTEDELVDSDEEEDDDEDDADENGNLKGFIVSDSEDDEEA